MIAFQQEVSPDSIKAAVRRVFAAPEYDWNVRRNPFEFLGDWYRGAVGWLAELQASHPAVYWMLLGVMTLLLLILLLHVTYLLFRALRPSVPKVLHAAEGKAPVRDRDWYLSEARRFAAEGSYEEALAHRFIALVLELDGRGVVRFHPSKTPAEYAVEAKLGGSAANDLRELVSTLYHHVFGGSASSEEILASFDRRAAALTASHARA